MSEDRPLFRRIDLGDNHELVWSIYEGDKYAGASVPHLKPDGTKCAGWIAIEGGAWAKSFDGKIQTWKIVQHEPITLEPSLLCRACGDHGYVREGKWVRA